MEEEMVAEMVAEEMVAEEEVVIGQCRSAGDDGDNGRW